MKAFRLHMWPSLGKLEHSYVKSKKAEIVCKTCEQNPGQDGGDKSYQVFLSNQKSFFPLTVLSFSYLNFNIPSHLCVPFGQGNVLKLDF